jgi:hypothetical protein
MRSAPTKEAYVSRAATYDITGDQSYVLTAPEVLFYGGGEGGSSIFLTDAAIELAIGGSCITMTNDQIVITVGGSTITLTGSTITAIAGLIELNP